MGRKEKFTELIGTSDVNQKYGGIGFRSFRAFNTGFVDKTRMTHFYSA